MWMKSGWGGNVASATSRVGKTGAMRGSHLGWRWTRLLAAMDCIAWALALWLATLVRYDFAPYPQVHIPTAMLLVVVTTQLAVGALAGLYTGRWRTCSLDEAFAIVVSTCLTATGALAAHEVLDSRLPTGAVIGAVPLAFVMIAGVRGLVRLIQQRPHRPDAAASRVVIFGAGDGAAHVLMDMLRKPSAGYTPVALLDDAPEKKHLHMYGIRVRGDRTALERVRDRARRRHRGDRHPRRRPELLRSSATRPPTMQIRVLPPVRELLDGKVGVERHPPRHDADLLGRHEIDTDVDCDRRTTSPDAGAGHRRRRLDRLRAVPPGRTGSQPAELVMLDRDESALHAVQLSIEGRALLDSRDLVVADIRDTHSPRRGLRASTGPRSCSTPPRSSTCPLLEMHPGEAVKTNVWGTQNVLEAAAGSRRRRASSTSPPTRRPTRCSVLGYTKRIAERLTAARRTARPAATYLSRAVRQRARQPGLGAHRLPGPDRRAAARSPSPTPTSPATS